MHRENRHSLAKRLQNLIEASHRLATVESSQALLPELIRLARDVVDAQACSLQLHNRERGTLEFAWVEDEILGADACALLRGGIALKLGEGVAGWVAANRRSALIADTQADERFCKQADRSTGFATRTLLSVPLIHQEDLLGVLNALNCKNKPAFDEDDRQILESFADLAAIALMRAHLLESKVKQEKLRTELEAAARIQQLLRPEPAELGHGSRFWACSEAAGVVGGDLCDLIPRPDGSWLVYVADVSGKGLAAAMVMTALWSRMRSECSKHRRIERVLAAVNEAMVQMFADRGYFATVLLTSYHPADGLLEFTCGGHVPPLRIAAGAITEVPLIRGVSVGLMDGAVYERARFVLEPGESALLVTDGVTEATNARQLMFGREALASALAQTEIPPWGPPLLQAVRLWSEGTPQDDDLTIAEIYRPHRLRGL